MVNEIDELCNRIDNAIANFDPYMLNKEDYLKGMIFFKSLLLSSGITEINNETISEIEIKILNSMDMIYKTNGFKTKRIMQGIQHCMMIMYTYNNIKKYDRRK